MDKIIKFSDFQELKKMGISFSVIRHIKTLQKHFNKPIVINAQYRCSNPRKDKNATPIH